MEGVTMDLMTAVGSAITAVLGWVGIVIDSLITAEGDLYALLPLFAVGIGVTAIMLGIKVVRGFIWGA